MEFFDISRYLLYVAIFLIYSDLLHQTFIFSLPHYQKMTINGENNKLTKAN